MEAVRGVFTQSDLERDCGAVSYLERAVVKLPRNLTACLLEVLRQLMNGRPGDVVAETLYRKDLKGHDSKGVTRKAVERYTYPTISLTWLDADLAASTMVRFRF